MFVFYFNGTIFLKHDHDRKYKIINHDYDLCYIWSPPCSFSIKTLSKTFSGTRKTSSNQNSHSLQRNNSHKHNTGNGSRNLEAGGGRSGKHVASKEIGGVKITKPGKSSRGHSSHNNHVSEMTSGLHVSGAPEVTGPRGHHSHDAHYFVDYWGVWQLHMLNVWILKVGISSYPKTKTNLVVYVKFTL